jgi:hypothetical protein
MTQPPQSIPTPPAARFPVSKKLTPGQAGTKRYQRQFGDALVCVRYRHHPEAGKRYTTVEIIVDERQHPLPTRPHGIVDGEIVAIQIGYAETDLRQRAKQSGAKWDNATKHWLMPYRVALELGLHGRIKRLRS